MAIPILGQVFDLVGGAIDKIWPDADTKEKAKSQIQLLMIQQAMQGKQLMFQDTDSARELYKAELAAAQVPRWTRAFQVLARPFTMYSCVGMYVWVKLAPLFDMPTIAMTERDYYLLGAIFVFLFGARTLEKMKGKA
jgi:hypothetical protein